MVNNRSPSRKKYARHSSLQFSTSRFYNISAELRCTLAARESNSLLPWAVVLGAFLYACEDKPMTVRDLRAALSGMEATSEVQVVLFKNDGTSQVFELEEVLSLDGHTRLEIYEAEEAEAVTDEGDNDDHP
jgi:hypothetical protein